MALKPCKECKAEISTSAKTCPHCGKPNLKGNIGCLGIFLLFGLGGIIAAAVVPATTSHVAVQPQLPKYSESQKLALKTSMEQALNTFVHRLDCNLAQSQVIPELWEPISFDDKKVLTAGFGAYCEAFDGATSSRMKIIDAQTGKTLLEYSPTWGYKVP